MDRERQKREGKQKKVKKSRNCPQARMNTRLNSYLRVKIRERKRAPESGREYMANNWADDTDELPPLGTLSNDEPTKTTSTPKASAEKTYVPPHLRNRPQGSSGDFGGRRDFGGGGGRRDFRGRLFSEK